MEVMRSSPRHRMLFVGHVSNVPNHVNGTLETCPTGFQ